MPETPDFDRLVDDCVDRGGLVLDRRLVAEQLRLIWNARGEADLATKRRWERNQYAQIRALDR